MIPKIIHYCWFGGNPIPPKYKKYIDSWRKYLPDYKIKEWNEINFNINAIAFTKEAYSVQKFAYVSDYARLKILYENGGVYFDTDVEVIRNMDDIIEKGSWMGVEKHKSTAENDDQVAIGLGFAVEPHNEIIKEIMSFYENAHFIQPDGTIHMIPIVPVVTNALKRHGMPFHITEPTIVDGITIYPWDYFCPLEFMSTKLEITPNTYTIHHYSASWMTMKDKFMMKRGYIMSRIKRIFGLKPKRSTLLN